MTESTRRIIPFDATDCDPPELLTVAQAAVRVSVCEPTIAYWIKGGLPFRWGDRPAELKHGPRVVRLIDAEDLLDYATRKDRLTSD
jgi:hypothetical protein